MNFYLVFDHYYSGIIQSQVVDVVEFLESETSERFTIIAFVNIKRYSEARAKYRTHASRVVVLPNFGFSRWSWSMPFLAVMAIMMRPKIAIGRSVFANQLALVLKKIGLVKEVVFDARGAEFAEWSEYFFKNNQGPVSNDEVKRLEINSIEHSDRILAVSSKLMDYWNEVLGIEVDRSKITIIPSTLSSVFTSFELNLENRFTIRENLNVDDVEVLIVFSGANSDWHAFDRVLLFCDELAQKNKSYKFLFLTNSEIDKSKYHHLSPKLHQLWLKQEDVPKYLAASDYALLLRDDSWTNFVSSPVKFAEYLACGCRILISNNIGDYNNMVKENELGFVLENWQFNERLFPLSDNEQFKLVSFGKEHFTKKSKQKIIINAYLNK